jgi:hypothetical protein
MTTPQPQTDEILRLAVECGLIIDDGGYAFSAEEQLSAFARKVAESEREACAALIPTSWLDPLLSGNGSVIRELPADGPAIQSLLAAIAARIRSRTSP